MRKINSFVLVSVLFLSCVSTPPTGSGVNSLPGWVVSPPADTSDTVYFVGSGSADNDAAARSAAASDLVSSVTRFLGVKVTSETTVTAKDTLRQFSTTLNRTIHETSSAQLGDFRVVDTYVEEKNGVSNVYLLGAYNKKALFAEKKRIRGIFIEQQQAISGPEAEGDSLVAKGNYYQGAVKYIEAASAAALSSIDNAKIKYERNMDKARTGISHIKLSRVNDNLSTYIAQPFKVAFQGKITGGGASLSNVPIKIVYRIIGKNGRKTVRSVVVSSNNKGLVSYTRPPASFVGTGKLTMILDLSSVMEKLQNVSNDLYPAVESLEKMIGSKKVDFTYTILSHAKEIPTGILVIDEDNSKTYTGSTETASGILESLTERGFSPTALPVESILIDSGDEAFLQFARDHYGNTIRRLIFGNAGIVAFQEEKGMYTVKVSGTIKVVDLETGRILYSSGTRFKTAIGSNVNSAMSAAFKQFGKEIGRNIANTLP